jgi:hypothetical protein
MLSNYGYWVVVLEIAESGAPVKSRSRIRMDGVMLCLLRMGDGVVQAEWFLRSDGEYAP